MPSKNPRINITLEPATVAILASLSAREHKSTSSLAKELILEAIERREDMVLSAIAESRDNKDQKTIKHTDVWK